MVRKGYLKNILNRIIWSRNKKSYNIIIIDRLSKNGIRVINGEEINGLTTFDQMIINDGSVIPLHRIIEVTEDGRVLIKRELKK